MPTFNVFLNGPTLNVNVVLCSTLCFSIIQKVSTRNGSKMHHLLASGLLLLLLLSTKFKYINLFFDSVRKTRTSRMQSRSQCDLERRMQH